MIIVSNSSPLINLARIGRLSLLHQLYSELTVPEAVWREVVVEGAGKQGSDAVKSASWIKKKTVGNIQLVRALQQELDAGEAEAIALAVEIRAGLLLMDDHMGRETARHLGLQNTGLVGALIEAKHKGFISAIKPCLNQLRDIAGFRLSEVLLARVLHDQGE